MTREQQTLQLAIDCILGLTGETLQKRALLENGGSMHDSMRNIILSAVSGEGLEMTLGSPLA